MKGEKKNEMASQDDIYKGEKKEQEEMDLP